MAYERTNWQNGDVISSEKLNKMEAGIEYACSLEHEVEDPTEGQTLKYDAASGKWVNGEGGGSDTLIVNVSGTSATDSSLDKTWQEISDAFPNVYMISNRNGMIMKIPVVQVQGSEGNYFVYGAAYNGASQSFAPTIFSTETPEGYPAVSEH